MSSALAFRLAPRINAAGRLYRADAALELLLTDDGARAEELAGELDRCNAERRAVETRIRFEAEALVAAGPDEPAAHVLAAAGWHPGVIGIVAARIAERHHRPVVLIALPEDGERAASGSGRSIPGFDLLGGLAAAGEHLERYGGHRAAAGLTIDPAARGRLSHCVRGPRRGSARPGAADGRPNGSTRSHPVRRSASSWLRSLRGWRRSVRATRTISLLLPAATFSDPVGFGGERRDDHARFTVNSGGGRARAVLFGSGPRLPVALGEPVDASFTLERDEWQGVVQSRLLLRSAIPCDPAEIEVLGEHGAFLERALAEFDRPLAEFDRAPLAEPPRARVEIDRRGRGVAALVTQLLATGEPAARARRRRAGAPAAPQRTAGRLRAGFPRRARTRSRAGRALHPPRGARPADQPRGAAAAHRCRGRSGRAASLSGVGSG